MLQNYIHMRFEELAKLKRTKVSRQSSQELITGNLFKSLIFFMNEVKSLDQSLKVLLPSDELVLDLRKYQIPRLISIVIEETKHKIMDHSR